jgi:hypothetical protein
MTATAPDTVNIVHELERALFGAAAEGNSKLGPAMILAMLDAGDGISDLIFSPGRPSQIERHGDLIGVQVPGIAVLHPEHSARGLRAHRRQRTGASPAEGTRRL